MKERKIFMALGLLMILFVGLSVISILGLLLLYLVQAPQKKKGIFCFLALWGLLIAALSASGLPSNYLGSRLTAWGIGLLGIIGMAIYLRSESKTLSFLSYFLITVCVVGGILYMYF